MMGLDLSSFEQDARNAVKQFWQTREGARKKQQTKGTSDQGERSSVTAGKNMNGFLDLVINTVKDNGLPDARIMLKRRVLTLPGYFRPTKNWDLLIFNGENLVGVFEFKSQVGPSFGNNANNRCEEAVGSATDFWTAYREGAFGDLLRPFVGYVMMLEDCKRSRTPVSVKSPHYPIFSEFREASYADRYNFLCQKLVKEQLYTVAALVMSPKDAISDGNYSSVSNLTSLKTFISILAGHIAAEAARE